MRGLWNIQILTNVIDFYGKTKARAETPRALRELVSKLESSYEGHTVDALVPEGDEGRDKLR